jgi:hypothetical protein
MNNGAEQILSNQKNYFCVTTVGGFCPLTKDRSWGFMYNKIMAEIVIHWEVYAK